jgi:hypothetical protein
MHTSTKHLLTNQEADKMKLVTVTTNHGLMRGLYNVKAGLVEYTFNGSREYAPASAIVSALLIKQAF